MNETTFENAIVGDRVWDFGAGWGKIDSMPLFPEDYMRVEFHNAIASRYEAYNLNGVNIYDQKQTLFWDEIKFEAPPRPKRMVKKVVEGYVNLQEMETGVYSFCLPVWNDKEEAERKRFKDKIYLGEPFFIHHEYEVEE